MPRPSATRTLARPATLLKRLPVYLDGTLALYRPWRWPKVRVVIGAPLRVDADPAPSRERSPATAQRILDPIHALR